MTTGVSLIKKDSDVATRGDVKEIVSEVVTQIVDRAINTAINNAIDSLAIIVGKAFEGMTVYMDGRFDQMVTKAEFEPFKKETEQSFYELGADVDDLTSRMGRVETKIDTVDMRLGVVETKIDTMDARLSTVETKLDHVDVRLDTLETKFGGVEQSLSKVHRSLGNVEEKVDTILGFVDLSGWEDLGDWDEGEDDDFCLWNQIERGWPKS